MKKIKIIFKKSFDAERKRALVVFIIRNLFLWSFLYDFFFLNSLFFFFFFFFFQGAISLSEQIQDFKKYIGKLEGMVGEERTNFILATTITFSVASSNDIASTYFLSGIRRLNYDFPSYADIVVKSASNFVKVTSFTCSSVSS
jgi:hypothetical protein